MSTDNAYIFTRKHLFYEKHSPIWQRSLHAYSGGTNYVNDALIKHVSENILEFRERKQRAYYFNYPRKIARLITQYVLSQSPTRDGADSELVEDFDRAGLRVNEVMRQLSTMLNVYGLAWLVIDMPGFDGELTKEQEQNLKIRPYCYALPPLAVVDWSYGSDGNLLWALTESRSIDNSSPFEEPKEATRRYLWERDKMTVYKKDSDGAITVERTVKHQLGIVPFVKVEESDGYGMHANHWFEDVVKISDAILNNESEAQMNTVKQMFGLLVVSEAFARNPVPEENPTPETEGDSLSLVIARSAAVWETEGENGITRYVSPSGAETATIRSENQNLRRELFDVIGLAIQKDSKAIETAEAKAWDHQNVEQFLQTRADILEQAEKLAWNIIAKWKPTAPVPNVVYNRNFSVLDLKDAIGSLIELSGIAIDSQEFQKEVSRTGISLLNRIRQIPQESQDAINKEIDALQPDVTENDLGNFKDTI